MKFKLKNAQQFEQEGLKGWAYNTKEDFPGASTAYIEVQGRRGKVRSLISDRIYFVMDGKGEFMINGEITPVRTSDVIIVPKGSPYNYWGTMKLFLVHTPAYDPESEENLEDVGKGIKKIKVRVVRD